MQVKCGIRGPAIAAVLGLSLLACGTRTGYATDADIPESLGTDGVTVVVGDRGADTTVQLYEDLRCPACEEFETQGAGTELHRLAQHGSVQVHYTLASFLDDKLGGNGSRKAVNALRAALAEDKFVEYHQVLYAHQPDEVVDGYTDDFILKMASRVEGLWATLRHSGADDEVPSVRRRIRVCLSELQCQRYANTEGQWSGTARVREGPPRSLRREFLLAHRALASRSTSQPRSVAVRGTAGRTGMPAYAPVRRR
ncbi:DsbA family protein [Streptomyces sp. NPDC057460]|uniref:DsbA family protein n=1 Tax=Streptomyces sp. NPDC057460 TaxID=3346141 RepID=UPI0036A4FF90